MKTTSRLFAICITLLFGQYSYGQISGSAHDFSTENWNNTGELCVVCHTPHNAQSLQDAPLWNHELTVATFTLYSSPTFDATDIGQPDASSKLCLSCHDGTVALENFGGKTNGINYIGGSENVGTDLSNDHPVSFTYDATLATADPGLWDPTTTSSGLSGTIDQDLLFAGKVQCASCHDVHNADNNNYLLVVPNNNSALCLTCHNK